VPAGPNNNAPIATIQIRFCSNSFAIMRCGRFQSMIFTENRYPLCANAPRRVGIMLLAGRTMIAPFFGKRAAGIC
jgi:hypothetical protein